MDVRHFFLPIPPTRCLLPGIGRVLSVVGSFVGLVIVRVAGGGETLFVWLVGPFDAV